MHRIRSPSCLGIAHPSCRTGWPQVNAVGGCIAPTGLEQQGRKQQSDLGLRLSRAARAANNTDATRSDLGSIVSRPFRPEFGRSLASTAAPMPSPSGSCLLSPDSCLLLVVPVVAASAVTSPQPRTPNPRRYHLVTLPAVASPRLRVSLPPWPSHRLPSLATRPPWSIIAHSLGARSSTGQSGGLRIRGLGVRILSGAHPDWFRLPRCYSCVCDGTGRPGGTP